MEVREPEFAYGKKKYTIEEYLETENASEVKHEYYQGEIVAMAGALLPHNFVRKNILTALGNKLSGNSCQPYNGDARIYIKKNALFAYPDLVVICGKPETLNDDDFNVLNPTIIFEVLSPSTRNYDKGTKFGLYRDIPTLKEYVLVEPEKAYIEAFHINTQGFWELRQFEHNDDALLLHSINISLLMKDIYKTTSVIDQLTQK